MTQVKGDMTNIISDIPKVSKKLNVNLINPWGIVINKHSIWVAVNGSDMLSNYKLDGTLIKNVSLIDSTKPTSLVINKRTGFNISNKTDTLPAQIIAVTESGSINAFNELINSSAIQVLSSPGKIFKGVAISGDSLFVTEFHGGFIEKYDNKFSLVSQFTDTDLQSIGYVPFNIVEIKDKLYVSFALQNNAMTDSVPGVGNGYIDVFDTNGTLLKRFANRGPLNSPWGMVTKCINLGCKTALVLLVGNFGDGIINIYDIKTKKFINSMKNCTCGPITIDGLWGLAIYKESLLFAAGIQSETHGLVGKIRECFIPCKQPCKIKNKCDSSSSSSDDSDSSSSDDTSDDSSSSSSS